MRVQLVSATTSYAQHWQIETPRALDSNVSIDSYDHLKPLVRVDANAY